jgi:hypothetical protein
LERTVRDSEPSVLEDRERRERNCLLAKEQKQKKDSSKRKHDETIRAREALETTGTLISFRMRKRSRASGAWCPQKGLLPGGQGLREARFSRKRGQGSGPLAPAR